MSEEFISNVTALPSEERKFLMDTIYRSLNEEGYFNQDEVSHLNSLYETAAKVIGVPEIKDSRKAIYVWGRTLVAAQLRREGITINQIGRILGKEHSTIINMFTNLKNVLDLPEAFKIAYRQYVRFSEIVNNGIKIENNARLTGYILELNGWEWKTPNWVLKKSPIRLGWNPDTHKFYIGYGELPNPIDYVYQLRRIYQICEMHKEDTNFKLTTN